jgi:transposase, IS6 family
MIRPRRRRAGSSWCGSLVGLCLPGPAAWHHVEQYANHRIEADHSRLKHRLRPMRGLRADRTAVVIITGLAFMQNLRRGHYELAAELPRTLGVAAAFTELAQAI